MIAAAPIGEPSGIPWGFRCLSLALLDPPGEPSRFSEVVARLGPYAFVIVSPDCHEEPARR